MMRPKDEKNIGDPASLLSHAQCEQVRLKVKRSALPLLTVALAWFRWGALGRKASSVDEDKILTTQTSEAPSRQSVVLVSRWRTNADGIFFQVAASRHGATKVAPWLPSLVSIREDTSCETLQPSRANAMYPGLSLPSLPVSACDEAPEQISRTQQAS
jgi:hypothetical protein